MPDESKEEHTETDPTEAQKSDIHWVLKNLHMFKEPGEGKFVRLNGKVNWGGMFVVGIGPYTEQDEVAQPEEPKDDD
jgi:hypothetical protein